jgi:hypothetical protein
MVANKDKYFYGSSGTQGLKFYEQIGLGAASGALKIGEGIAELGAGFADYAFDTDFLNYLEKNYPKINVDDGLGKAVELIVQYGVPYTAALKIAGKVSKVKDLGRIAKAGGVSGVAAKVGYYGLPAAVTEPLVATSRDATLGQALGLYSEDFMKQLDPTQYEGRDRAAASLQQKLLFGLEAGPAVGGITTALGPVLKGAGKAAATIASPVTKAADAVVLNPLSKAITSEYTGLPQFLRAVETGRVKLGEKLGIPEYKNWGFIDTNSTSTKDLIFKRTDEVLSALRTRGPVPAEFAALTRRGEDYIEGFKKTANVFLDDIESISNNLAREMGETSRTQTRLFTNNLIDDVAKYVTGDDIKSLKNLNPNLVKFEAPLKSLKNNFDLVRNHVKDVVDPEELKSLFRGDIDRYLKRSFDIVNNSSFRVDPKAKLKVAGMFMRMMSRRPEFAAKSREELKEIAESQVDDLINIGFKEDKSTEDLIKGASTFLSKEFGVVKDVLKPGEDLPKVIRQLFGESKDAKAQLIDTIADFASIVGKKDTFDDIARIGEDAGWIVTADNAVDAARIFRQKTGIRTTLQPIKEGGNVSKLVGDSLLGKNKYATREVVDALQGQTLWSDFLLQSSVYKSFLALKGASQLSKTVLSPTTQIRNVESAAMFALANGHFGRGASLSDSMGIVFRDIFGPDGKISADMLAAKSAEYRELGITNSNIITREIRALTDDLLRRADTGSKLNRSELLLKTLQDQSVLGNMTKIYQGGDDLWKIFGYEFEKSKMLNIIKEGTHLDDADKYFREIFSRRFDRFMPDGKTLKTREQVIKETAAEIIKNTYPNYSYVPSLVQNLRRLPLGNFISFPAEMYRTSFNLMKFGLREMRSTDPLVRQSGARKLIGFSSALAVGKVAQEIGQEVVGVTNEQLDAIRESFVAPWNKSGPLVPVAKEVDGDKVVYKFVNFAYQSPYDVIAAPYYAAMTQFQTARAEEKDIDQAMLRAFFGSGRDPGAFTALVQPFVGEAIITEKLADLFVRGGKTRSGRKILSEEDTVSDVAVKGAVHLLEGITPGAFTQATNFARGIAGEQTTYGKDMNPGDEALALFAGIRINEANIGKSMGYQITNFVNSQQEARRLLSKNFADSNLNSETIYREYEKMLRNKFENFGEIRKVFDDAQKLGFKRQNIIPLIDRRAGFTKRDKATVFKGVFLADSFTTITNDARFRKNLRDRGIPLTTFLDLNRLREIYARYNGRKFGQGL